MNFLTSHILLNLLQVVPLVAVLTFFLRSNQARKISNGRGWTLIVIGIWMLLFGTLVDTTKDFNGLDQIALVDGLTVQIFLQQIVGLAAALIVLTIGIVHRHVSEEKNHRQVSEELVEKSNLLETALKSMDQGFLVWDHNDRVVVCNQRYRDLWNYPDHLLKPGAPLIDLIRFRADSGAYGEGEPGKLAEEQLEEIRSRQDSHDGNFCFVNGRELFSRHFTAYEFGYITICSDVTKLKQIERELLKKSQLLRTALNSIDQGFVVWDSDNNLVVWNERYGEIWKYPTGYLRAGMALYETAEYLASMGYFGNGDKSHLAKARVEQSSGRNYPPVENFTTPDGRTICIRRSNVAGLGQISTYTDITGMARIEKQITHDRDELAALNEQKDKLFAILAHDLTSPFNALLGFSEVLSTRAATMTTEKIEDYGRMIHQSADDAHELVVDLLNWSLIQLDRMDYDPKHIDIANVANTQIQQFASTAALKSIRLESDIENNIFVDADSHMLDIIFRNIINNAIKFTSAGAIVISASRNGPVAELTITDTGVGMSEAKVAQLFNLGEKVSTTGTGGESGTGLGLHLCKDLIEKQGGTIHVDSEVGRGTSVRFSLPLASDAILPNPATKSIAARAVRH